jgi:hypothetical protein
MHTRGVMRPRKSTFDKLLLNDGLDGGIRFFKVKDLTLGTPINCLPVMHNYEL